MPYRLSHVTPFLTSEIHKISDFCIILFVHCQWLQSISANKWTFFFVALRPNPGHGLLILEVSRSHTTTHHSRYESSGRVISSSQRPLPDNTQHSQQTNIRAPGGIQTHDLRKPQTYALDRAATGTGNKQTFYTNMYKYIFIYFYIYISININIQTNILY